MPSDLHDDCQRVKTSKKELLKMSSLISRSILSAFVCILLSSCAATIELNKVASSPKAKVTLTDNRPADERVYRRDGPTSPIRYLGDESFSSPPLQQLSSLLENELPPGDFFLDVQHFRVIDIFPHRMNTAIAGGLGGILGVTVTAIVTNEDNISCLVSGKFQGKAVSFVVSEPYRISPFAGLIVNDPSFKGAVNDCLSSLAHKIREASRR